jgi:hypothetical protein
VLARVDSAIGSELRLVTTTGVAAVTSRSQRAGQRVVGAVAARRPRSQAVPGSGEQILIDVRDSILQLGENSYGRR